MDALRSHRLPSLAPFFAIFCIFAAAVRAQEPPPPPPTPIVVNLQAGPLYVEPGWTPAAAENADFRRLFGVALQAAAEDAALEARIVRSLPSVNYLLIRCTPRNPLVADDKNAGETSERPSFGARIEEFRRRLMEFPFVEYCAYNPVDAFGPRPLPAPAADRLPDAPHVMPAQPETVPGELVVILNGGGVPVIRITGRIHASPDDWQGLVTVLARIQAAESDVAPRGAEAEEQRRTVFVRSPETDVSFLMPAGPGPWTVTFVIDPENDIAEGNESDNQVQQDVGVPPLLATLHAETEPAPEGGTDQYRVRGDLVLANLTEEAFDLESDQVQAWLDGRETTIVWDVPSDLRNTRAEWTIPPLSPAVRMFVLESFVEAGEHELRIVIAQTGTEAVTSFRAGPPPPAVNLAPLPQNARAGVVTVQPSPLDRRIHDLIENAVWTAFPDRPVLASVQVRTASLPIVWLNSIAPISLWDCVVTVTVWPGIETEPVLVRLREVLADLWFVRRADVIPPSWQILDNGEEGGDGEADDQPAGEAGDTDAPDESGRAPVPYRGAVGLVFDPAAQAHRYLRVELPVARCEDLRDDSATNPADASGEAPDERLPVLVEFEAVERENGLRALAGIPLFGPGRMDAVGFLDIGPSEPPSVVTADVDPTNEIPETDEDDNVCQVDVSGGASNEPVFYARATLRWGPPPLVDQDPTPAPELLLEVVGVLDNRSTRAIHLEFPSTLQMDFWWDDRYRWSEGRVFAQFLTTVDIPAGDRHVWRIAVPFREVWRAGLLPDVHGRLRRPPAMILDVELVGTQYHDQTRICGPFCAGDPDADGDLLPDAWEKEVGIDGVESGDAALNDGGQEAEGTENGAGRDADGDGWSDLLEFLYGSNPMDAGSIPEGLRRFVLSLTPGWNLISIPVEPMTDDPGRLFGDGVLGRIWTWVQTADGGGYQAAERILPHCAYWVYSPEGAHIEIPGVPDVPARLQLLPGWNLSGQGGPVRLPLARGDVLRVWRWNPVAQEYEQTLDNILEEGRGYWIYTPTILDVDLIGQ